MSRRPERLVGVISMIRVAESMPLFEDLAEVLAVRRLCERIGDARQLLVVDVAHVPGDLFGARDLQVLAALDDLDEARRLEERLVRSGVEPRGAAPEAHDAQGALVHVD